MEWADDAPEPVNKYVAELGRSMLNYRAPVRLHAPAERIAARVPAAVVVEAIDEQRCFADVGSDSPHMPALWIGLMDTDFEVGERPELAAEVRGLAERCAPAAG